MPEPRVLFFTTSYPSSPVDRAGPFVHSLARALVRVGVEVDVLAPASAEARGRSAIEGVNVQRFQFMPARWQTLTMGFGGVPAAMKRAPWRLLQLPLMLATAASLALRRAGDYDVLHAHWLPNLLPLIPAARLRHKPRLVTLWGSDVEMFERSPRLQPLLRSLLRGADGVVAINEHMRALFGDATHASGQLRLIPSGVDADLFRPRPRDASSHALGDDANVRIVCVGSLIPRKGVDVAIRALAATRGATLLLVGEGPERPRLEALARDLDVHSRTLFLGERTVAEVAEIMAASDAFVLPSHYEGRPNVVLEAQASGLAVVASDIPGCRDLIEHGVTGLLAPAGDATALAATFVALVEDAGLRARLGTRARAAILDGGLTWEACARRYAEFYCDLRGSRAAAPVGASAGAQRS